MTVVIIHCETLWSLPSWQEHGQSDKLGILITFLSRNFVKKCIFFALPNFVPFIHKKLVSDIKVVCGNKMAGTNVGTYPLFLNNMFNKASLISKVSSRVFHKILTNLRAFFFSENGTPYNLVWLDLILIDMKKKKIKNLHSNQLS